MADENKLYFIASDICLSEQKSNDIFILIEARLLSTRANQNKQGVTRAFIDEVVNNPLKYDCLPLYCDTDRLLRGDHQKLGHMMTESGQFDTTQIGSITSFREQDDEYGTSLIAEIRIPKREYDICQNVMELYNEGSLNFSFEIRYSPSHTVTIDGVEYVDAFEGNVLCGMCLVSIPAYPESTALMLTAELQDKASEAEGVEKEMEMEEMKDALAENEENSAQVIAESETESTELNEVIAEKEEKEDPQDEQTEDENKDDKPEEEQEEVETAKKKACAENEEQVATAGVYEMECLQNEINRLRVELASAAAAKAELEAIKAEMAKKELEANQAFAKSFAEKQGLDVSDETVSKAIAELDYRMIAELSMAKVTEEDDKDDSHVVVASIASDGFEMKSGKWDDLLASRK